MALGVLRALNEAGRRVPADVSLVGFDDIPEAAYLLPPLTTVHQDFVTVGRQAIDVLGAVLRGDAPPSGGLLPAPLVVRASTAPIRSEARWAFPSRPARSSRTCADGERPAP